MDFPANTGHVFNFGKSSAALPSKHDTLTQCFLMLGRRHRRRPNIKKTLGNVSYLLSGPTLTLHPLSYIINFFTYCKWVKITHTCLICDQSYRNLDFIG